MRWIGPAVVCAFLMVAGCSRPTSTTKSSGNAPSNNPGESPSPSVDEPKEIRELPVSPVVKKRSPEALRQRIRDTVARMQAEAEPRRQRQALQRVGDAVHASRRQTGEWPADTATSRLSWRVTILPALGEERLYREFHHDEPWDSPHNEALIARMPKVYGDDPLGHTRVHLLTGQSSSPVLLIAGKEETQGYWTRPAESDPGVESVPEWVVLREGRVCRVDATTSIAAWQAWANGSASPSLPEWLEPSVPHTTVREIEPHEQVVGGTSMRPALPSDTWCAIHLEPRRLLANPHMSALFQQLVDTPAAEKPPTILDQSLGSYKPWLRTSVASLNDRGLAADRLNSLTIIIPTQLLTAATNAAEAFAVLCQAVGPTDVEGMIAQEMEKRAKPQYREQGRSAGIIDPRSAFALHFADESTVLFGGQSLVARLSEALPDQSMLTAWLSAASSSPVVVVMDAAPLQKLVQQRPTPFPPMVQEPLPFLMEATGVVFTLDPDHEPLATLTIRFHTDEPARNLHALWARKLDEYRSVSDAATGTPDWQSAVLLALTCEHHDSEVRLTLHRSDNLKSAIDAFVSTTVDKN